MVWMLTELEHCKKKKDSACDLSSPGSWSYLDCFELGPLPSIFHCALVIADMFSPHELGERHAIAVGAIQGFELLCVGFE